jgi:hypothetical protein
MKTLRDRVFEVSAEARATGSIDDIYPTIVEVKNSNETNTDKIKMLYKLKESGNIALGKTVERPFTNYDLSKKPY